MGEYPNFGHLTGTQTRDIGKDRIDEAVDEGLT